MQEQTRRMDSLVRQLLTLSRIKAAPVIDIKETVDEPMMLRLLQREAETLSGGRYEIHFHTDPHLKVLVDDDQLRRARSNLVYNAVNHTPDGTRIDISWLRNRQSAQFKVCDNGPSIPAEHLPRLTERFYCVDKRVARRATSGCPVRSPCREGGDGCRRIIERQPLLGHQRQPLRLHRFSCSDTTRTSRCA
ncbi:Phosphate regulon sensor protein PhoR|nr:Phosphate regulon sensor protein PhoR [Candidatus Pantoea persica]